MKKREEHHLPQSQKRAVMFKFLIIVAFAIVLLTLLSRFSTGVTAMSAMKGKINFKDQPLTNIKITRTYTNPGKTGDISETTYTNEKGEFHFSEVKKPLGLLKFLPHEAVIHQEIKANYLDKDYLLWFTTKRNYDSLGEFIFNKETPKLSPESSDAFNSGYILLNADLKNHEEITQQVNPYISLISTADFKFPYDLTLKKYANEISNRKDEFDTHIRQWFEENPAFFNQINTESNNWSEWELTELSLYKDAKIESIEHIDYQTHHIFMPYFDEDFDKDTQRINVNGSVILNVQTLQGENLQARVWLRNATFEIDDDKVTLQPSEYIFSINAFNINPAKDNE